MMTKTISRYFITVVFISLALCALLSTVIIYSNNVKTKENEMQHVLKLIEYSLDYSQDINKQINKLNPLVYNDDSRITIIDEQGNILGDSYNDKLKKHYKMNLVFHRDYQKQQEKIHYMLLIIIIIIL